MCQGGTDPKHALKELQQGIRFARREIEQTNDTREPLRDISGFARALLARFRSKDVTHV